MSAEEAFVDADNLPAEPGTKAFGKESKLMLGPCSGGALRLSGGPGPLVVAEGTGRSSTTTVARPRSGNSHRTTHRAETVRHEPLRGAIRPVPSRNRQRMRISRRRSETRRGDPITVRDAGVTEDF